jgi:hypothetical protein
VLGIGLQPAAMRTAVATPPANDDRLGITRVPSAG